MSSGIYIILICWAYLAEIAWTLAWFWSSSIFLPIASQVLSFKTALLLVAIYHIFWNMSRLAMFYTYRNKSIFILFGIPSIIATVVGAYLVSWIDPTTLKIALWVVLCIFAWYKLFFADHSFKTDSQHSKHRFWRIGGALSGFSAWIIGTWWVLRWAFMSVFTLPKEEYIATIASIALLVDATRIPIYFSQWFLDVQYLWLVPILFVIAFLGSWTAKRILSFVPETVFKRGILIAIILGAVLLVFQGING